MENTFNMLNEEELLSIDGGEFREWARGVAKASIEGGVGCAAGGMAAGALGAPFTAGVSIPTCGAMGYIVGATAGAGTYIAHSLLND